MGAACRHANIDDKAVELYAVRRPYMTSQELAKSIEAKKLNKRSKLPLPEPPTIIPFGALVQEVEEDGVSGPFRVSGRTIPMLAGPAERRRWARRNCGREWGERNRYQECNSYYNARRSTFPLAGDSDEHGGVATRKRSRRMAHSERPVAFHHVLSRS